jgi:hypothetical protein
MAVGRGDHWITGGALAISTLAAGKITDRCEGPRDARGWWRVAQERVAGPMGAGALEGGDHGHQSLEFVRGDEPRHATRRFGAVARAEQGAAGTAGTRSEDAEPRLT